MIAILSILVLVAAWAGLTFNRFIRQHNLMRAAWSDVDVQLKRRHDLIPQLIASVKAYAVPCHQQSPRPRQPLAQAQVAGPVVLRVAEGEGAVEVAGEGEHGGRFRVDKCTWVTKTLS